MMSNANPHNPELLALREARLIERAGSQWEQVRKGEAAIENIKASLRRSCNAYVWGALLIFIQMINWTLNEYGFGSFLLAVIMFALTERSYRMRLETLEVLKSQQETTEGFIKNAKAYERQLDELREQRRTVQEEGRPQTD